MKIMELRIGRDEDKNMLGEKNKLMEEGRRKRKRKEKDNRRQTLTVISVR